MIESFNQGVYTEKPDQTPPEKVIHFVSPLTCEVSVKLEGIKHAEGDLVDQIKEKVESEVEDMEDAVRADPYNVSASFAINYGALRDKLRSGEYMTEPK